MEIEGNLVVSEFREKPYLLSFPVFMMTWLLKHIFAKSKEKYLLEKRLLLI